MSAILVKADWDDEVGVWVATSTDIDGLAIEAPSMETLRTKVLAAIEDLLIENGSFGELSKVPVHIFASQTAFASNPVR